MYGVKLKVWGDYACFTRPEMKAERVSYDVMTPSAARGILEAIYWKPAIRWAIDRIHVLNPIKFDNVRRNEVGSKIPFRNITCAMNDGKSALELFIEEDRQQRAAMVLRNACYVIEAHFEFTGTDDNSEGKHLDMFIRRAEKGQCFHRPYFGCREFPVSFETVAGDISKSALQGEVDLGWMLHDIDFKNNMEAKFFRARMVNGIIDVPSFKERRTGMIIQALNEHYLRLKDIPDEDIPLSGFSRRGISFVLIITEDGTLVDINDIRDERKKAKQMIMPAAVIRTRNANQKPNFLCDSAKFVLGYDMEDIKSSVEAHDNFCKLHKEIGDSIQDEGMQAVLKFLTKWKPEHFKSSPCHKYQEDMVTANITFKLESQPREYIHDRLAVKNAWLKHYFSGSTKYVAMCLVTGKKEQIAQLHEGIKGVANPTHPVGAIVSFNKDSFCSYNKEQSFNAPVSKEAMFNYTTALNHLLRKDSRQKIQIGDATTVFWAERDTPVVGFLKDILDPRDTAVDMSGLRLFLEAVRDGKNPELAGTKDLKFYILGLAPNAKRLSVRFWHVSTVGEISKKIGQHFSDLRINPEFDNQPDFPGMWQLLHEIAAEKDIDKLSPLLSGAIMRAIITGEMYPRNLLPIILSRIRAEASKKNKSTGRPVENVTYFRAALIKAYLVRYNRIQQKKIKEVGMALNKEQKDIGYLLGRLFAVLEKAQKDAIPGANTTIKDRFYGSASATPSLVFPQLMRLAQHHIQKSGYGGLIEKAMEGVMVDIEVFPAHLSLEEQGMFALGYYHQKPEMYKKTEKKEEE